VGSSARNNQKSITISLLKENYQLLKNCLFKPMKRKKEREKENQRKIQRFLNNLKKRQPIDY
jgi:hypothetical protein